MSTADDAPTAPAGQSRWFYTRLQLALGAVVFGGLLIASAVGVATGRIAQPIGIALIVVVVGLALWYPGIHTARVGPSGVARPLRRFIPADRIAFVTLRFDGVQYSVCLVLDGDKRLNLMPRADIDLVRERALDIAEALGTDYVEPPKN